MPNYSYTGVDDAGKKVSGWMEAASEAILEGELKAEGIWLVSSRRVSSLRGGRQIRGGNGKVKVRRRDLIGFLLQLSLLLRSGVTLPQSLKRLAKDLESTPEGSVVGGILEQVEKGNPFSQSLQQYPRVFTPQMGAVIEAGEVSGKLPEVIDDLRTYMEWLDRLLAEVRQALIYPLIVLLASLTFMILLFSFVVPRFANLFESLSLELPLITQLVMEVSRVVQSSWYIWILALASFPLIFRICRRIESAGVLLDRILMKMPLFGGLLQMFALSRFCTNLAMLYKAGIPILKALEICQDLVGNRAVSKAVMKVHEGVREGSTMSSAMANEKVFPVTFVTLVSTGEASGKLHVALENLSDYYNDVIPRQIKALFSVFEPTVMLTLIGMVGTVAASLILPIMQIWQMA